MKDSLEGVVCEATVWERTPLVWPESAKKRCVNPAKAVRGPQQIPVCGIHLRSRSVYRYKRLTEESGW